MMEPLILSSALPRPRTPLSLPSSRSPSMKVKNSLQICSNIQVQSVIIRSYNSFDSHARLSCSISPRSLLGAVQRLYGSLSGLRLHRLRPVPHGVRLDPEQTAHPVWGDRGAAARHPVLYRSQRGQVGPHQPGWDLLQPHGPVNRDTPVSGYRTTWTRTASRVWCVSPCRYVMQSQCNKPVERKACCGVFCL